MKEDFENYYSIGEIANLLGIHEQTIRMYERKNLISPKRNKRGIRLFTKKDIDFLELLITLLQDLGMTYNGVQMVLALAKKNGVSNEELYEIAQNIAKEK